MSISSDKEYESLAAAIAAIGSEVRTLEVANAVTVSSDLTVPQNVTLSFALDGQINVAAGATSPSQARSARPRGRSSVVGARSSSDQGWYRGCTPNGGAHGPMALTRPKRPLPSGPRSARYSPQRSSPYRNPPIILAQARWLSSWPDTT